MNLEFDFGAEEIMIDANIRVLPRVCNSCKDLIMSPISEQLCKFDDIKCTRIVEVCRKCKDKNN